MSVDLNRLTAHLSPQQQEDVKQAYHRGSEHSTTAFLYCFFLGTLGAHRFYLRQWRKGFTHLIVLLALAAVLVAGVALKWSPLVVVAVVIPLAIIALTWEIIDLFTIDHEVYEHNLKLVERLIGTSLLGDHTVERREDAKLESVLSGTEAQATAAARHDRVLADAGSAATLAQEPAAVAQPVPALQSAAEAVTAEQVDTRQDASAALATDAYIATTTTQISGDDPAGTQHATQQPSSWSETEQYHAGEALTDGAATSVEETDRDGGALAAAEMTDSVATGDDFSLDQSLTRTHEASDFSVTDSAELMTNVAAADSRREDEQAFTQETPLSTREAEAVTWPDHDLVAFDEPVADASPAASEAGETGGSGAEDAALFGVGGAALAGAGLLLAGTRAPSSGPDATDSSQHSGSVESIADVEGADATPLYVTLPPRSPAEREYFDSTDRAV
ncbi:MAG: TM2 domain-containing protein, partial [Ktedonobacterales bacterium]